MSSKPKKMRNVKYYTCCECAFFNAIDGKSSHWIHRQEGEGRCVTENKDDPCPLGLPFVEWIPHEELPETLEEAIEQGELEDSFAGEDLVDHCKRVWEGYRIPHNQFTKEEYEE